MSFTLRGLGTALPESSFSRDEGLKVARALSAACNPELGWLENVYAQSGVEKRHQALGRGLIDDLVNGTADSGSPFLPSANPRGPSTALRMAYYAELAPPLAVKAAALAVAESGVAPDEFTHLVTVSCTGFVSPGVDFALIRELGLPPTVERTHVGFMGCHGAINGLRVADALAAKPDARVLLACVELSSINYYYGPETDKVVANALFADGAAAAVGHAGPAEPGAWRVAATGSCVIPETGSAMGWLVRDNGFEMILSRQIPRLIARNLRPWIESWLARHDLTIDAVGSWAIHPGGPKILTAAEEGLGLTPELMAPSRGVLRDCGNMSSPTVLFIAERLRAAGAPLPCVMIGFGPGLVAEAVLWR